MKVGLTFLRAWRHLQDNIVTEENLHRIIGEKNAAEFEALITQRQPDLNCFFRQVPPLIALIQHLVQEGFLQAVEFVLLKNLPCRIDGRTLRAAFEYALRNDLMSIVRVFVTAILERTIDCCTVEEAFECAVEKRLFDLALLISVDARFDANAFLARHRRPPLHLAVTAGQPCLVGSLLGRGAVVDSTDQRGCTALVIACRLKSLECCRMLLVHGADPNYQNPACRFFSHNNVESQHSSVFVACISPPYYNATDGEDQTTPCNAAEATELVVELAQLLRRFGLARPRTDFAAQRQHNVVLAFYDNKVSGIFEHPLSLELSCVQFVRRHLVRVHQGTSIVRHLASLPLPPVLISHHFLLE